MGLNVYFCDVCGVRVTDVDLRSGHGILRGQDVICATCLEMGHGKEWLASRGISERLPVAAAADTGLSSAADVRMVINAARDRAVTVPDGPLESGPLAEIDYEDTRAVAIQRETSFSGAASGFAALTSQTRQPNRDDDGRLDQESSDEVDPVLLPESSAEALDLNGDRRPTSRSSSDREQAVATIPRPTAASSSSSSSRVVAKSKSDRLRSSSGVRNNPSSLAKGHARQASAAISAASSGKAGSSKPSKSSKPPSTRIKRTGGGGMPMPLKVSLFTVPLLLLSILAIFLGVGGSSGAAKQADVKDLPAQKARIEKDFSEVKAMINSAYGSKNVAEMKTANQRWQQFLGEWDGFAKDAQRYSGWTDDQVNSYWEGLKAPDVGARTRLLRDEIAKQSAH